MVLLISRYYCQCNLRHLWFQQFKGQNSSHESDILRNVLFHFFISCET